MRVTPEMTIEEALRLNEHMAHAFIWIAEEFERLRDHELRREMARRVTVEQAARIGHIPLAEALYVLNLAAGEEEQRLTRELTGLNPTYFEYHEENLARRPRELSGLRDNDPLVHFIDAAQPVSDFLDPQSAVMRELSALGSAEEVLLVHESFDPIPLRDRLAERGYASWAEERGPHDWYVYFFRPRVGAGAAADPRPHAMAAKAG